MSIALIQNPIARGLSSITALKKPLASEKEVKPQAKKHYSFFGSIVDSCKTCLKFLLKANPFSIALTALQNYRSVSTLKNAVTRNAAKDSEAIASYHESIKFSDKNPQGIFQFHKSTKPGPKTQVILLMGRGQLFDGKEEEIGMLKIYNRLKRENNCDVLLCRAGSAIADLKHRYGLSADASLKPEVVKEHVSNLIEDRLKQAGSFSSSDKARNVVIAGYSWGAGLEAELLDRWSKISGNTPVSTSITLDGIEYGCENFADELKHRPKHSAKHINIFQNADTLLSGSNLQGMKAKDKEYATEDMLKTPCPDHDSLDDCDPIVDKIYYMIADDIAIPEAKRELKAAA